MLSYSNITTFKSLLQYRHYPGIARANSFPAAPSFFGRVRSPEGVLFRTRYFRVQTDAASLKLVTIADETSAFPGVSEFRQLRTHSSGGTKAAGRRFHFGRPSRLDIALISLVMAADETSAFPGSRGPVRVKRIWKKSGGTPLPHSLSALRELPGAAGPRKAWLPVPGEGYAPRSIAPGRSQSERQ